MRARLAAYGASPCSVGLATRQSARPSQRRPQLRMMPSRNPSHDAFPQPRPQMVSRVDPLLEPPALAAERSASDSHRSSSSSYVLIADDSASEFETVGHADSIPTGTLQVPTWDACSEPITASVRTPALPRINPPPPPSEWGSRAQAGPLLWDFPPPQPSAQPPPPPPPRAQHRPATATTAVSPPPPPPSPFGYDHAGLRGSHSPPRAQSPRAASHGAGCAELAAAIADFGAPPASSSLPAATSSPARSPLDSHRFHANDGSGRGHGEDPGEPAPAPGGRHCEIRMPPDLCAGASSCGLGASPLIVRLGHSAGGGYAGYRLSADTTSTTLASGSSCYSCGGSSVCSGRQLSPPSSDEYRGQSHRPAKPSAAHHSASFTIFCWVLLISLVGGASLALQVGATADSPSATCAAAARQMLRRALACARPHWPAPLSAAHGAPASLGASSRQPRAVVRAAPRDSRRADCQPPDSHLPPPLACPRAFRPAAPPRAHRSARAPRCPSAAAQDALHSRDRRSADGGRGTSGGIQLWAPSHFPSPLAVLRNSSGGAGLLSARDAPRARARGPPSPPFSYVSSPSSLPALLDAASGLRVRAPAAEAAATSPRSARSFGPSIPLIFRLRELSEGRTEVRLRARRTGRSS